MRNPVLGGLNAGFLNQVQALKWVQARIAHFGGDLEESDDQWPGYVIIITGRLFETIK